MLNLKSMRVVFVPFLYQCDEKVLKSKDDDPSDPPLLTAFGFLLNTLINN